MAELSLSKRVLALKVRAYRANEAVNKTSELLHQILRFVALKATNTESPSPPKTSEIIPHSFMGITSKSWFIMR